MNIKIQKELDELKKSNEIKSKKMSDLEEEKKLYQNLKNLKGYNCVQNEKRPTKYPNNEINPKFENEFINICFPSPLSLEKNTNSPSKEQLLIEDNCKAPLANPDMHEIIFYEKQNEDILNSLKDAEMKTKTIYSKRISNENFMNIEKINGLEKKQKVIALPLNNNELDIITRDYQKLQIDYQNMQDDYIKIKEDNENLVEINKNYVESTKNASIRREPNDKVIKEISNEYGQEIISIKNKLLQKIQNFQIMINQLQTQVEKLNLDLDEKIKENEQLSVFKEKQETILKDLQMDIAENKRLQEKISELQKEDLLNKEIINKQKQNNSDIEEEKIKASKELTGIINLLCEKDKQLKNLEKILEDKDIYSLNSNILALKSENDKLNQKIEEFHQIEEELRSDFERKISNFNKNINHLRSENKSLLDDIYSKENLISKIEKEKSNILNENKELLNEKMTLSEQIETLKKSYQIAEDENISKINNLEEKILDAENKKIDMDKYISTLIEEKKKFEDKIQELVSQLEEIVKQQKINEEINKKNICEMYLNEMRGIGYYVTTLVSENNILREKLKEQDESMELSMLGIGQ